MRIERIKEILLTSNNDNDDDDIEAVLEGFLVETKLRPCILYSPKYTEFFREIFPGLVTTTFNTSSKSFILVHHSDYQTVVDSYLQVVPRDTCQKALGSLLGYWYPMSTEELFNPNTQLVVFQYKSIPIETQRVPSGDLNPCVYEKLERYNQVLESVLDVKLSLIVK